MTRTTFYLMLFPVELAFGFFFALLARQLGYGWRTVYVVGALGGAVIAATLARLVL